MKTKLLFILFFPFVAFAQMSDADYDKAVALLLGSDREKAIANMEAAEKKYPNTDKALLLRGIYQSRNGKQNEAMLTYSNVIRMNPKFVNAYELRAFLFSEKGMYAKAIADITKAIELEPTERDYIFNRSTYYLANKQYKEALEDTKTRFKLKPNDYYAYLDAANISMKLDPNYDVNSFFKQSYATKGNLKYKTDLVFGHFLFGNEKYDEARVKYEAALAVAEKDFEVNDFNNIGFNYYKLKMYDKSIFYFNKAISMSPQDVDYLHNLNMVYNTQQNSEMVKIIAQRVLDINPNDVWGNQCMAIGLINTGQEALGNEYHEKAMRLKKEQNK